MLQQLLIKNIAIADNIDIDWQPGMTSISGETGAGKSILLNSLNLALGERADSGIVRFGESRAEVVAVFNIARIPAALGWLKERELDVNEDCILRRTISSEGRSRAFINSQPVPLVELKTLGEYLIDIHSQHAHQSLLRQDTHLRLLDDYINHGDLLNDVKNAWMSWQGLEKKRQYLLAAAEEKSARIQLLEYQCAELEDLSLEDDEVDTLEAEYQRMRQSESLLAGAHKCNDILAANDDGGVNDLIKSALSALKTLNDRSDHLDSAKNLLESAAIQLEEGLDDIARYIESFEFDEERSFIVEERLNKIHELARKHQVPSNELASHFDILNEELAELKNSEQSLSELTDSVAEKKQVFITLASKVSKARRTKAKAFEKEIVEKLEQLAMPGAQFKIAFSEGDKPTADGLDKAEFHISLNQGQPLQSLGKVASGGELSRVSLAIQVVCAEHSTIPTLVFDEVDVGISGATAEIVGHMLRSVGQRGQVICVTHLPQVAALGHNHCVVAKEQTSGNTTTQIKPLIEDQRITEIARMLGGIDITAQTRAHAQEMLNSHRRAH